MRSCLTLFIPLFCEEGRRGGINLMQLQKGYSYQNKLIMPSIITYGYTFHPISARLAISSFSSGTFTSRVLPSARSSPFSAS